MAWSAGASDGVGGCTRHALPLVLLARLATCAVTKREYIRGGTVPSAQQSECSAGWAMDVFARRGSGSADDGTSLEHQSKARTTHIHF